MVPISIMWMYAVTYPDSEIIDWLQSTGIIYEIIGFVLMVFSTSSSFILKIKMKIPKENYGIIHPNIFKSGVIIIIVGLLFQLMYGAM